MKNLIRGLPIVLMLLGTASIAYADLSVVTGKYVVVNKDCLETGNAKDSSVLIESNGSELSVEIDGVRPVTIHMIEGKVESTLANGNSFGKNGISFGNGFAYGETERDGRSIVSDVEYEMNWQDGELLFTKTERVNARHKTKVYCDLKPAQ
jgi:hypothetical protein